MLQEKIEQKNHSRVLSEIYFPHKSYGFIGIKKKKKENFFSPKIFMV